MTYWGLLLARNVQDRYATSSKIIVTLGVVLWTSAIGALSSVLGFKEGATVTCTGILCLPVAFFLAYRSRNTYLLILTLLGMFHWIGAWNEMCGRSAYVFAVQDPYVMCVAALVAVGIGVFHERKLYPRTGRFYKAWESLGLVYLNMSLLILSIWAHNEENSKVWIVVFTIACLAQIVVGARWQNGLLRGFGITFFVINVFTRYHELFWNNLDLGTYLMVGGVWLAIVGGGIEASIRVSRTEKGGA